MSSFYKCSFFSQEAPLDFSNFLVEQEEIVMKERLNNEKISFYKKNVTYRCSFLKQEDFDSNKPTVLIPTKDNRELLAYTIKNLKEKRIDTHANIIVIDDRSEEDVKSLTLENELSYLRVDNDKGFNFSMLNNIAAKLCYDAGVKEVVLWNSDLWCVDESYFLEVLKRHRENGSKVSGTKLVYPPIEISLNKEVDSENIKTSFPNLTGGKWRETVQFGGDCWIVNHAGPLRVSPFHFKRFSKKENALVNCDRGSNFVTGAFHVLDLKYFIEVGGLNPSLSKNFQDADLCLRTNEAGEGVFYFGKDVYFYHDESLTMHNLKNEKKNDGQMVSDYNLFAKLWNDKLPKMVF